MDFDFFEEIGLGGTRFLGRLFFLIPVIILRINGS